MLNENIRETLKRSVLCWLATVDESGFPNVSPKEVFAVYDDDTILIANIASPTSVKNIEQNASVCVSCLDIFRQKGVKLKGNARNVRPGDDTFAEKHAFLFKLAGPRFPIRSIIEVRVEQVFKIVAPAYILYPETTEEGQIENAMKSYGVRKVS